MTIGVLYSLDVAFAQFATVIVDWIAIVHHRVLIPIADVDIALTALRCIAGLRGIVTIVLMGEPQCVAKFMNGDARDVAPRVFLALGTPVLEGEIEHHSVFFAVEFSSEPLCVRTLIGDLNSNALSVIVAGAPTCKRDRSDLLPGVTYRAPYDKALDCLHEWASLPADRNRPGAPQAAFNVCAFFGDDEFVIRAELRMVVPQAVSTEFRAAHRQNNQKNSCASHDDTAHRPIQRM